MPREPQKGEDTAPCNYGEAAPVPRCAHGPIARNGAIGRHEAPTAHRRCRAAAACPDLRGDYGHRQERTGAERCPAPARGDAAMTARPIPKRQLPHAAATTLCRPVPRRAEEPFNAFCRGSCASPASGAGRSGCITRRIPDNAPCGSAISSRRCATTAAAGWPCDRYRWRQQPAGADDRAARWLMRKGFALRLRVTWPLATYLRAEGAPPLILAEDRSPSGFGAMNYFTGGGIRDAPICVGRRADQAMRNWSGRNVGQGTRDDRSCSTDAAVHPAPTCQLNAWAKPDVRLVCGDCEEPMAAGRRGGGGS